MADDLDTDLGRLAPLVDTGRASEAFRRRQRRSQAYRRVALAATAVLVLVAGTIAVVALSDDDAPVRTVPSNPSDGAAPRVWVQEPTDSNEGMAAEVKGELVYRAADDCVQIELEGLRYPIVWPTGTEGTADGPGVVLPGGVTARVGDEVYGGGGYLPVADEFGIPAECVPETGEVAVYNSNEQVAVTLSPHERPGGASCADIERFAARITDTGITYDYEPSDSPEELMAGADVVFAGTLTGETATHEGDERLFGSPAVGYEVRIDTAYNSPPKQELAGGIQYAWIDVGTAELFEPFQDVAVEEIPVVVFGYDSDRGPGYSVGVEGFVTGCPADPIMGAIGSQGTWADVTTLYDLKTRLATAAAAD